MRLKHTGAACRPATVEHALNYVQTRRSHGAQPAVRPAVRAGKDRSADRPQPLLRRAACRRHDQLHAAHARRLPRHEGRGRLGRGVQRLRLDPPELRRCTAALRDAVGRRRRARACADDRGGACARRARRCRAVARRRLGHEPRQPPADPVAVRHLVDGDARQFHGQPAPARHGRAGHTRAARLAGTGSAPRAQRRLRHRVCVRRHGISAVRVPAARVESAPRRLRRQRTQPRAHRARAPRGHARGGRRTVRRGAAHQSGGAARPAERGRTVRSARGGGTARRPAGPVGREARFLAERLCAVALRPRRQSRAASSTS